MANMKLSLKLLLCFLCSFLSLTMSAKILSVMPLASHSHQIMVHTLLKELVNRGHDVTFFTTDPIKGINSSNYKEIIITSTANDIRKRISFEKLKKRGETEPLYKMSHIWSLGLLIVKDTLETPDIQELIHSDKDFDLILIETHFGQEAFVGFGERFHAPVISVNAFGTYVYIDEFIGNPMALSYVPSFEYKISNEMTFLHRVYNTVRATVILLSGHFYYLPQQEKLMKIYFNYTGSENMPSLRQMLENIALVILNSHPGVDFPRPYVPNLIQVGGIHIEEKKPLPKELKDFMDNSKNGVIYFSLGSFVPSEQLPEEIKQVFLRVFSKLEYDVVWKFPVNTTLPTTNNVKISQWVPQRDLLGHPKCITFITHGGLMSQLEALNEGVPLVSIPVFADQQMNTHRAVDRGIAVPLYLDNITEDSVMWAINEVTNNPSYRINMKKQRDIFKDHEIEPLNKAIWWIEYIIRHNGAPHLRSNGRKLPWYQLLLLDVIFFFISILVIASVSVYAVIKFLFKFKCGRVRHVEVTSDKKRN